MASFKPRPGTVMVIRGDIVEAIDMTYCEICRLWHVDRQHALKHAVEPEIKEVKIAGLLSY